MTEQIQYKGDNPQITKALENIRPICLEDADFSIDPEGRFGVIDGFLAVIDGREDLPAALKLAREIIQDAPVESVCIVRNSPTIEKSRSRIDDVFYHAAFGNEAVVRPNRTVGSRPAKQGTVLINPDTNEFYLKKPGSAFSDLNTWRSILGMDVPEFEFQKSSFWRQGTNLGPDFKEVFGETGKIFPEYMSVYLSNGDSTSEAGVMHFDSGYTIKEVNTHGPNQNRTYSQLPKKFIEAANSREFEPLPGGVTITSSLKGGGSIVRKTDPERFEEYQQQKEEGTLLDNKAYFYDRDQPGYQAQDGDILIMRTEDWPDDPQGNPRLPSDHCAAIINAYGNDGNHLGRIIGLMSSEVCYMSPQVRAHLGMSRMPDPEEFEPAPTEELA